MARIQYRRFLVRLFIVQCALVILVVFNDHYHYDNVQIQTSNHSHVTENSSTSIAPAVHTRPKYNIAENYTRYATDRLRLKPLSGVTPLQAELGPVINDVLSFQYEINNGEVCQRFGNPERTVLAVVVSAASHFEKRQLIRKTWARTLIKSKSFDEQWGQYVFLIGSSDQRTQQLIANESRDYGDVIQIKMADHYSNLTIKSVALLHWISTYCSQVDYVLKCDDDIFVNVYKLASFVTQLPTITDLYGSGAVFDKPKRHPSNKYYVSEEEWPWLTYPGYLFGGAYLIGRDAVRPLLAAAQTVPFFRFEDVYITGLCTKKVNINIYISDTMYRRVITKKPDPCLIRSAVMWQTQEDAQLIQLHKETNRIYRQKIACTWTCNYLNIC